MPLDADADLTIRYAQPGDAAVLAQLVCELGYETTKSEMQTRMERIATDERYRTFVAVFDGNVCGMIGTLTCASYEHNDTSGRILALVTSRVARRRGIGRALIATARKISLKEESGALPWIRGLPDKTPTSFTSRSGTSEMGGGL